MAVLTCKASVRFKRFTPALMRILNGLYVVAAQWTETPELVITSADDSTHRQGSRHYSDEALDIRVKNLPTEAARQKLLSQIKAELGPAFTVLYENAGTENAHVHCQAKKGSVYAGPIS